MTRWYVAVLGATLAMEVHAQALDINDKPFVAAAVVVMGYDLFAGRCAAGGAFTAAQRATVDAWQRANDVDLIRGRITALETAPGVKAQFDKSRGIFATRFASIRDQNACIAAVSLTRQPDAQIAATSPEMLRRLRSLGGAPSDVSGGSAVQVAAATSATSAPSAGPSSQPHAIDPELVHRIDSFGFDTRPSMGIGGFIGLTVYPVVLFRDGTALTDVEGLGFAGGIGAHRTTHPKDWTRWRRAGAEIQLENASKHTWDKLAFTRTYSTLPRDFRLSGRFTRASGVGNVAIGGVQSVTVVSEYLFAADGRVVRDGAVGSTGASGDMSVATSRVAASRRGHYTIDGITLQIRYDDGSMEQRILVTDPADPKSVIWLDGDGFVRR